MKTHFIKLLEQNNWVFESPAQDAFFSTPERYKAIPADLREFLSSFHALRNENDTMWFLSSSDYAENNEDGFKWNEFELMSLEAALGDEEWTKAIQSFWSQHLPIFISVEAHYQYLAYCVDGLHCGKYVFAEEPEFESTSVVASNIEHAIDWLISTILCNDIQESDANA